MAKKHPDIDLFHYERLAAESGEFSRIAGVDEAGRGPLAGPVVVAAVILPPEGDFRLPVTDSKALTEKQREFLAEELRNHPGVHFAIVQRSASCIDQINILEATHEAMREAVLSLSPAPDFALIDGLPVKRFPIPSQPIVKGDALSASIAAASILAKTCRDHFMLELDKEFPEYGFAKHKGYGTREHLEALRKFGPCPQHRRSFGPVARCLNPPSQSVQLFLPFGG